MRNDTRMALLLMGELVSTLGANEPGLFKRWLSGGLQDLGESVVEQQLLEWLDPFLRVKE